jgi:hypothetical protein
MSTIKVDTLNEKSTNGNIAVIPTGSGKLVLDGLTWPHADGSASQLLKSNGSGVLSFVDAPGLTQSAVQATTSGTSVTFGSIPAGVKMIIVTFTTVSFSGSANIKVQIGDSGGIETSGYISSAMHISTDVHVTDSFLMYSQGQGANAASGSMICTLQDADNFTWVESVSGGSDSGSHGSTSGGGTKSLSAELTQVKVSGGTFDLGKISIVYM